MKQYSASIFGIPNHWYRRFVHPKEEQIDTTESRFRCKDMRRRRQSSGISVGKVQKSDRLNAGSSCHLLGVQPDFDVAGPVFKILYSAEVARGPRQWNQTKDLPSFMLYHMLSVRRAL